MQHKTEKDQLDSRKNKLGDEYRNTENDLKAKKNEVEQCKKQRKKFEADIISKKNTEKDMVEIL